MANKRNLKHDINLICSDLFAECLAIALYSKEEKEEHIEDLLQSILNTHADFIRRVSHPEPGMPQKKYFKALTEDFENHVNELIDQICNL